MHIICLENLLDNFIYKTSKRLSRHEVHLQINYSSIFTILFLLMLCQRGFASAPSTNMLIQATFIGVVLLIIVLKVVAVN